MGEKSDYNIEKKSGRTVRNIDGPGSFSEAVKLGGWLFYINFFISAFTFGGGYVVIPMMRRFYVQKRSYVTEEELADMAALAQSSPGAIAINLAVLAGYRAGKGLGALIACIGALLPPLLLFAVVSVCYETFAANAAVAAVLKGMEAGVAALIADLVIDLFVMVRRERSAFLTWMVPAVFILEFFFGCNVALLLAGCIAACVIWVKTGKRKDSGRTA